MAKFYLLGLMAVSVFSEEYGEDFIINGTDAEKNEFPWQGEISIKIKFYYYNGVCHFVRLSSY